MSGLKRLLRFRNILLCTVIVGILIFACAPGLLGYTKQSNAVWIIIYANIGLFILFNAWEHIYLESNTVCAAGLPALTTDGNLFRTGLWVYTFGGNTVRTAGYNTNTGPIPGLQSPGRNMICSLASHCYQVGGQQGSEKRHLFITGQTEKYTLNYTPLELKNTRDQALKTPDCVYIAYFSSLEYDAFKEYSYNEFGTQKVINLHTIIEKNRSLDMEVDMYLALLKGNPAFIKQRIEGFNWLLKAADTGKEGIMTKLFAQQPRDNAEEAAA